MPYSVGSSDVGDHEEDPNIPTGVDCCGGSFEENDDKVSISSELSDHSMEHYGLTYNCKPDISEIAHLTQAVNYGDFANMASERKSPLESPVVLLSDSLEVDALNLTWSQLLDNEERQPRLMDVEGSSKSFIWTHGYDNTFSLSGVSLVFPEPFSTTQKLTRRPSDVSVTSLSWPLLRRRPRPFSAIKRFLSRQKENIPMFVTDSSCNTEDTSNSNHCAASARAV